MLIWTGVLHRPPPRMDVTARCAAVRHQRLLTLMLNGVNSPCCFVIWWIRPPWPIRVRWCEPIKRSVLFSRIAQLGRTACYFGYPWRMRMRSGPVWLDLGTDRGCGPTQYSSRSGARRTVRNVGIHTGGDVGGGSRTVGAR